jgi:hypothetical protein
MKKGIAYGALLLAAAGGTLLWAAGCPTSAKKQGLISPPVSSKAKPPAEKQTPPDEPIAPPKLPVAEFQGPSAVPPSEALPRLGDEPAVQPAPAGPVPAASPPVAQATAGPPVAPPAAGQPVVQAAAPAAKAPLVTAKGKHSGIPFDPIKENGPIFKGWPKPRLAIAFSGMEDGYIEPCGCAGLERMMGGMSRRAAFLQEYRKKGWPLVAVDVGGIARGFGQQAERKYETLIEGKLKMGYEAVAFGVTELRLPATALMAVVLNSKPEMFVAANVGLLDKPGKLVPTSRVIEAGGIKLGVTAVLGKQYQKTINNPEIELSDPVAALKQIVPELRQKADYLVLLAHATKDEAIALAQQFPEFNVVVVPIETEAPPDRPETPPGTKTLLIMAGHKGMYMVVLGLFGDARQPEVRYQRVPLDSRFAASPEMKTLMARYQDQLKTIGFAGLGKNPVPHPLAETNGRFVGSAKCESCHEESYEVWKKSKHAHAYDTLANRNPAVKVDPPRNFDPECVSCHVVGWHPTGFFPYTSGYEGPDKTPQLRNTGCEDCHGPGEKHCTVEELKSSNEKLTAKYRKAMRITKEESKKRQCATCHDLDNSPDFDFDKYYPQIEHHEEK